MTRHDFENRTEQEVLALLQKATPEQLLRLLKTLQEKCTG